MLASLAAEADFAHHTVGPDTHKKKKDNYIGRFLLSHRVFPHGLVIFTFEVELYIAQPGVIKKFFPTLLIK